MAFGGDGATMPMPLTEGLIHQNLGTQQIRLVRDWIPTQVSRTEASKLWIYQYRNSEAKEWNSFYAFPELEFLLPDWRVLDFWLCNHPDSNQVKNLLAVKFLRREREGGEAGEQEIYGKVMLVNNVVKRNLGGRTEVVRECTSEAERVVALQEAFGITLLESERLAIKETPKNLG